MYTQIAENCIAFEAHRCIAKGNILRVAGEVQRHLDKHPDASILIFDTETSRIVEIDFRGTSEDVIDRLQQLMSSEGLSVPEAPEAPRRAGRPKLGVVAREITLLPRHWQWLESQRGGASVALRRLVDEARKSGAGRERIRQAQEIAYRFMNAIAGDLPGFQEALRALYAGSRERFEQEIAPWPRDVRDHARMLAANVFEAPDPTVES